LFRRISLVEILGGLAGSFEIIEVADLLEMDIASKPIGRLINIVDVLQRISDGAQIDVPLNGDRLLSNLNVSAAHQTAAAKSGPDTTGRSKLLTASFVPFELSRCFRR